MAAAAVDVRLGFEMVDGVAVVYVIADDDYRLADGSFA
jgi:hypothetical protein